MRQQINHYWFRQWLGAWTAPSHYLNQCWNIVRNKLQWNLDRNSYIFIQENASGNIVCEKAAILSRGRWVKPIPLCRSWLTAAMILSLEAINVVDYCVCKNWPFYTLRPRQNSRHLADDIFKSVFFFENYFILISISLSSNFYQRCIFFWFARHFVSIGADQWCMKSWGHILRSSVMIWCIKIFHQGKMKYIYECLPLSRPRYPSSFPLIPGSAVKT